MALYSGCAPLPTTRLGSPLARRSHARTMGLLLESSGSQAQLCRKWHFGVLNKNFSPSMIGVQRYAGLSLVVLWRLACGRTKLANLLPEGSCKLGSLLASCPENNRPLACCCSCWASIEDRLWIHSAIGHWAYKAKEKEQNKRSFTCSLKVN